MSIDGDTGSPESPLSRWERVREREPFLRFSGHIDATTN